MGLQAKYEKISDKAVVGLILQHYESAVSGSWAPLISNTFQSNSALEEYAGVGNAPALREWVGQRLAKSLAEYSMIVRNKDFEATLHVAVKDLRRDKTGQLMPKIQSLALRAAQHNEKLLSALIDAADGTTISTAYDTKAFFADDHAVGSSGTMDNNISVAAATGTTPTATEASGAIMSAVQQLYGFKDDQGEPVNADAKDFLVMVPPLYWASHMTAVTKDNLASAADNPLVNSGLNVRVVSNPRLTWTTKVAVFALGGPTKPFLIQTEEEPMFEVVGEGSEHAFKHNEHLYGVKKSGNVAPWDFTRACLITYT